MKRIREIVWPWDQSSTLNFGFEETLIIRKPREQAEIISIVVLAGGEMIVCIEEHISDRIGKDRVLKGFAPSKAGRFEIPEDASFVISVPLAGRYGAMHVFELNRPPSLKIDPLYRAPSLAPHDPEPAPYSLSHKAWRDREALRIRIMNDANDRAGCGPYRLSRGYTGAGVENAARGVPHETR